MFLCAQGELMANKFKQSKSEQITVEGKKKKGVKRAAYSHAKADAAKAERRTKAEAMAVEYSKLSIEQKIAKLDAKLGQGVGAKKQRTRLYKQLEAVK
jgi:hypothetical protein